MGEEAVQVAGGFACDLTKPFSRGESFEEMVEGVGDDLSCALPCPGVVQDLDGRQAVANDPLSRLYMPLQFAIGQGRRIQN